MDAAEKWDAAREAVVIALRQRVQELERERRHDAATCVWMHQAARDLKRAEAAEAEVARLEGLIRDALNCDPALRPVEWLEWRIRAGRVR